MYVAANKHNYIFSFTMSNEKMLSPNSEKVGDWEEKKQRWRKSHEDSCS